MKVSESILGEAANQAVAYPYRMWGFGEGPGLLGALAAGELLGRHDLIDRVAQLAAPTLFRPRGQAEHLCSVETLLTLQRLRPLPGLRTACERWAEAVENAPRPTPGEPAVHRPDLPEWATTIWVDCLHTDGPGLASLGRPSAVSVVEEASERLQDRTGLFSHGYDVAKRQANGVHWGRGQGWALRGLVGTLAYVSDDQLAARLDALLTALLRHEDDGQWHTVVDDPLSPVEASISALVAWGVFSGIRDHVLKPEWTELGERSLAAVLTRAPDSTLPVSAATPVGNALSYRRQPLGVYPWGQGPLLLALAAEHGWSPEHGSTPTQS